MTEILDAWNSEKAKNCALAIIADNLISLGNHFSHDPMCRCQNERHCMNRVKICNQITEEALTPWNDYLCEKAKNDKKKIYLAGFSQKTPIQLNLNKTFFYITINPHKNIKLADFRNKFEKYIKSIQFPGFLAVLEQRGYIADNTVGQGFHAHILFKRKTPLKTGLPPSNIESKCRQSWQNFVGDHKSPNLINFQTIQPHNAVEKAWYMLGQKWEDKHKKQEADDVWRKAEEISAYYANDSMTQELTKLDPELGKKHL